MVDFWQGTRNHLWYWSVIGERKIKGPPPRLYCSSVSRKGFASREDAEADFREMLKAATEPADD